MMRARWSRYLPTLSLRTHSLLVSISLLFLTALLGARAYRTADRHAAEISQLAGHDLQSQALLVEMETLTAQRDQAERKYRITGDAVYAKLLAAKRKALADAAGELRQAFLPAYPELAAKAPAVRNAGDVALLRRALGDRVQTRLQHARDEAQGILRTLMAAVLLTLGVTGWLIYLFFRNLNTPIDRLKEATRKIKGGELSFRMKRSHGVIELQELTDSFNSMAERLEHLDRAKTEFLAMVSHEIKNPMAALKEGLALLATDGQALSPNARDRAFSACMIASKRLEFMINNLLQHSRMETGLFDFELNHRNLALALQTAVDEIRPMAERKNMKIQFDCASDLQADFNWEGMIQVLENLLMNAIKYGQEGTAIEVSACRLQKFYVGASPVPHVQITVTNSGKSVSPGELSRMFDRFYRGSNSSNKAGLGLGLHVVRRVVEAHHGMVTAGCADGRTKIMIHLPAPSEAGSEPTPRMESGSVSELRADAAFQENLGCEPVV